MVSSSLEPDGFRCGGDATAWRFSTSVASSRRPPSCGRNPTLTRTVLLGADSAPVVVKSSETVDLTELAVEAVG